MARLTASGSLYTPDGPFFDLDALDDLDVPLADDIAEAETYLNPLLNQLPVSLSSTAIVWNDGTLAVTLKGTGLGPLTSPEAFAAAAAQGAVTGSPTGLTLVLRGTEVLDVTTSGNVATISTGDLTLGFTREDAFSLFDVLTLVTLLTPEDGTDTSDSATQAALSALGITGLTVAEGADTLIDMSVTSGSATLILGDLRLNLTGALPDDLGALLAFVDGTDTSTATLSGVTIDVIGGETLLQTTGDLATTGVEQIVVNGSAAAEELHVSDMAGLTDLGTPPADGETVLEVLAGDGADTLVFDSVDFLFWSAEWDLQGGSIALSVNGGAGTDMLQFSPVIPDPDTLDLFDYDTYQAALQAHAAAIPSTSDFRRPNGTIDLAAYGDAVDAWEAQEPQEDDIPLLAPSETLIDLRTGQITQTLAGEEAPLIALSLAGVEQLALVDLTGNSTLVGSAGADMIQIEGTSGTYLRIDGGAGMDSLDISQMYLPGFGPITSEADLRQWAVTPEITSDGALRLEGLGHVLELSGIETLRLAGGTEIGLAALSTAPEQSGTNMADTLSGTGLNDVLRGNDGDDILEGGLGNDLLDGGTGNDRLDGGDGNDTLIGGEGDDTLIGGTSAADLRDVVFAGAGHDSVDGGYGNDELRGDAGNDTLNGGFGADTVIGGTGDDVLTGAAFGDLLFGGDGMDFINGGFGFDRVNGGAGADRFYHLGVRDHGSDWIQDYSAADGDVLVWGGGAAQASDFLVQRANTTNAGEAGVQEVFITHIPSQLLVWALVDGDAQTSLTVQAAGQSFDLLA